MMYNLFCLKEWNELYGSNNCGKNKNKVKLIINELLNECLTANQKISTIWCVLIINKQLVELLFIKR